MENHRVPIGNSCINGSCSIALLDYQRGIYIYTIVHIYIFIYIDIYYDILYIYTFKIKFRPTKDQFYKKTHQLFTKKLGLFHDPFTGFHVIGGLKCNMIICNAVTWQQHKMGQDLSCDLDLRGPSCENTWDLKQPVGSTFGPACSFWDLQHEPWMNWPSGSHIQGTSGNWQQKTRASITEVI